MEGTMKEVFWLNKENLQAAKKAFSKWEAKAIAMECDIPSITFTEETKFEEGDKDNGLVTGQVLYKVELEGSAPRLDDWNVVAQLEHREYDTGFENKVTFWDTEASQVKELDTFTLAPSCDHCEKQRKRKTTYLLKHNLTDEIVQIGSTCVDDFTKNTSLKALILNYKIVESIKGYSLNQDSTTTSSFAKVDDLVSVAISTIEKKGFLSKRDAMYSGDEATVYTAIQVLKQSKSLSAHESLNDVLGVLTSIASESTHFAINLENAMTKDGGYVNISNTYSLSVIVGAVSAAMNRIQKEKEKLEFLHEHIGIVKDRLELQLTLISTYTSNTEHGLKDTYYFTDSKKRRVKWKCWGAAPKVEMKKGQTYTLKATISKHENFGVPTTVINRCKEIRVV